MLEQQWRGVLPGRDSDTVSLRFVSRLARVISLIAVLGGGCGGDHPFGKPSKRLTAGPDHGISPPSVVETSEAFPSLSCVQRESVRSRIVELAGIAPPEFRRKPKPQDADWYPIRLDDIVVLPDGFAVLDGPGNQITRFSRDFRERKQWGKGGSGPMELSGAMALALGPSAQELWVLNGRPPRLVAFDLDGNFLRTIPLPRGGTDLAIDADGSFYIAHRVFADRAAVDSAMGVLVSVHLADGSPAGSLVRLSKEDWTLPRIATPLIVQVLLFAEQHRVAVVYPPSGFVEVYERGRQVSAFSVCLPERLRTIYQRQMTAADIEGQEWVSLVTGVTFDEHGRALAVGPLRDSAGQYHIDLFDSGGRARGSIVMPGRGRSLMSYPRFAGSPRELIGYNPNGMIALLAVLPDTADVTH